MPDEVCVYVVYNTFKHLVSTFPFIQSLAHEKKKDKNILAQVHLYHDRCRFPKLSSDVAKLFFFFKLRTIKTHLSTISSYNPKIFLNDLKQKLCVFSNPRSLPCYVWIYLWHSILALRIWWKHWPFLIEAHKESEIVFFFFFLVGRRKRGWPGHSLYPRMWTGMSHRKPGVVATICGRCSKMKLCLVERYSLPIRKSICSSSCR